MNVAGRWWAALPMLLWPPRCLVCDAPGAGGLDLCAACRAALPRIGPACRRCAMPMPHAGECRRCIELPPPYTATCAACAYGFPLDRLLPRFKFHADLAAGRLLSTLLAEAAARVPRPQALVPVPLHRSRLRERGYDQALELARPLARMLALPLRADGLRRLRATRAQTELDAGDRRRNLLGAFAAAADLPAHVALVDDVMTTGATLAEAARTLREAGVQRVDLWVVARAPGKSRA